VYDRRYNGKVLGFEPSGGLMNAALVMRDRETDSWWSIITGDAIGGELNGTALVEIPAGEKIQFGEWKQRYPNTLVLSVEGVEHDPSDPYDKYFKSPMTFRDVQTDDHRLEQKESIYAFQLEGMAYAVPHGAINGGKVFSVSEEKEIFLFRQPDWSHFASTFAYIADRPGGKSRFVNADGKWRDTITGAVLSAKSGFPSGQSDEGRNLQRLGGFDTFWYMWSATHEAVGILQ
jgi:hypothetical protein